MATRIRLARRGRRNRPFYHIVVADSKAPRDGRFVEKLGYYNPLASPSSVKIDFDRALYWVQTGAQPSNTVRNILSREGVLLRKHLLKGVQKGAISQEEADRRFQEWKDEKEQKLQQKKEQFEEKQKAAEEEQRKAEAKINEARKEELAKKKAQEAEAEQESQNTSENSDSSESGENVQNEQAEQNQENSENQ